MESSAYTDFTVFVILFYEIRAKHIDFLLFTFGKALYTAQRRNYTIISSQKHAFAIGSFNNHVNDPISISECTKFVSTKVKVYCTLRFYRK